MKRWYSGRSSSIGSKSRYATTTRLSSKDTRSRHLKLKNGTCKLSRRESCQGKKRLVKEWKARKRRIQSNGNYTTRKRTSRKLNATRRSNVSSASYTWRKRQLSIRCWRTQNKLPRGSPNRNRPSNWRETSACNFCRRGKKWPRCSVRLRCKMAACSSWARRKTNGARSLQDIVEQHHRRRTSMLPPYKDSETTRHLTRTTLASHSDIPQMFSLSEIYLN